MSTHYPWDYLIMPGVLLSLDIAYFWVQTSHGAFCKTNSSPTFPTMADLTLTGILAIALGEFFLQSPYTITTTSIRNAIVAPHQWCESMTRNQRSSQVTVTESLTVIDHQVTWPLLGDYSHFRPISDHTDRLSVTAGFLATIPLYLHLHNLQTTHSSTSNSHNMSSDPPFWHNPSITIKHPTFYLPQVDGKVHSQAMANNSGKIKLYCVKCFEAHTVAQKTVPMFGHFVMFGL